MRALKSNITKASNRKHDEFNNQDDFIEISFHRKRDKDSWLDK